MKLLLDTHILLWAFADPDRLSDTETAAIASRDNQVLVSVASLWEIAIKARAGRLDVADDLPARIAREPRLGLLPVKPEHAWAVRDLPRLHGDPFDHLLIAQAQTENLTLVTRDREMSRYPVAILGG